jgi:hypothetical protein
VHWDLSEDKVLLKYPDGYDQHSKPRFTISYTKPEEAFERIKTTNFQSETGNERKPLSSIILSGGCGQKKQFFLEFVAQFGNQVRSFTYISALHFPMEVIDLVRVLSSMQNLEEVDFRQLSLLQSKITNEEEFLGGIDEGKKLEHVKKIIFGEQAELTEFLVELIFRMMPNLEAVFDFPIHFLIQRPGFLAKERRGLIESLSWSERFFGFNEEGLVKDLNLLLEDSPRIRKGSASPEVNVDDGVEVVELKKLEDFNVNLFQRISTFKGIYQIFGI